MPDLRIADAIERLCDDVDRFLATVPVDDDVRSLRADVVLCREAAAAFRNTVTTVVGPCEHAWLPVYEERLADTPNGRWCRKCGTVEVDKSSVVAAVFHLEPDAGYSLDDPPPWINRHRYE